MANSGNVAVPAWIYKRDGQLVPFDADKVSQSLFAATENLGEPNAFLARELTDSILHFLKAEADNTIPTTTQVADLVVKVVRELGQPALAQRFAEFGRNRQWPERVGPAVKASSPPGPARPWEDKTGPGVSEMGRWIAAGPAPAELVRRAGRSALREFSLREVFSRDLVAAQAEGLLTITGLEEPLELAHHVLGPFDWHKEIVEAFEEARLVAGQAVAIDGPEYGEAASDVARLARQVVIGLRTTGLRAVINLNCLTPPAWANELAEGPLFLAPHLPPPESRAGHAEALLDQWTRPEFNQLIRIDWHLADHDFSAGNEQRLLVKVARRAVDSPALAFVFDRSRRPVALAEGLDRHHPGALLIVGLHLPQLMHRLGLAGQPERFVPRIASLARLAVSAGMQKRDFLRRHSATRTELSRAFLQDRSRLIIVPVGLEAVVQGLLGHGICDGERRIKLARQIVQRLEEVLREDDRLGRIEACVDSCRDLLVGSAAELLDGSESTHAAGLTAWDVQATPRDQIKAAGSLHALVRRGTAAALISPEQVLTVEEVVDLLRYAWKQTELVRLRLVRIGRTQRQLEAPWMGGP
jgi:hypothetical protein